MIEFLEVTRDYGRKRAVDGLTLSIGKGEVFALLGPNGAGKTTTIKMLVGLLRPGKGRILLGGYDGVEHPREVSRLLAYVPDEPYLYEKLTGREFLTFIGQMYGLPNPTLKSRLEREIGQFGLHDFVDQLTQGYSHGMKQRLAFAAALLRDPAILVLDEPMVGLDPRSARIVKDRLRGEADQGMSVFVSTHTLPVAEEIADRIGIVDHGKLLFVGTLGELRALHEEELSLEQIYLRMTSAPETEPGELSPSE